MTYVGLMVSIVLMLSIVFITVNFRTYVVKHKQKVKIHNEISQKINNKIAEIYNEDNWQTLEDENIESLYGNILVRYDYQGLTDFNTVKLNVTFNYDESNNTYDFERSVYRE